MPINLNKNVVIRMLGVLFLVLGIALLPAALVGVIYGEKKETLCFLGTAIPVFLIGLIIRAKYSSKDIKMKQREGYLVASLFWIIAPVVGSIPMVLSGAIPNPIYAFFELCSGFSTTGASIMSNLESQAKSIMFWRSMTHFLGGMGIVVLITAILPSIGIGGQTAANAETPGPTMTKLTARFSDTAKRLYILYLVFTAVETLLLVFGGMSLYDALIHTFGTVGTGGFSNYSDSVGHFASPYIRWVITVFMVLCGINFNLYFFLLKKRWKEYFQDEERKLFVYVVIAFSAIMAIDLMVQGGYENPIDAVSDSCFQVASIITTTGYATTDFDVWPALCKVLIFFIMITGACSSSTGGGVKMIRILTAIKFVRRGFFLKLHPNRVINLTVNRKPVEGPVVTGIINFIFFYLGVLFAGMLLISVDGHDIVTNFSAALTCLSNVGPGFNMVGPTMNFSIFSPFSTVVLSVLMIAGRLELFTFFILFSPKYWNSNRA